MRHGWRYFLGFSLGDQDPSTQLQFDNHSSLIGKIAHEPAKGQGLGFNKRGHCDYLIFGGNFRLLVNIDNLQLETSFQVLVT
jgi:hypothetical protein